MDLDRSAQTKAGMARARANGIPIGRPQTRHHDPEIARRLSAGESVWAISIALRCHARVVRRVRDGLIPKVHDGT